MRAARFSLEERPYGMLADGAAGGTGMIRPPYLDRDAEHAYLIQIIKDDDLVLPSWRTASSVGSSDPAHLASRGMWSRRALRQAGSLDRDKAQLMIEGHLLCRR